MFCLKLDLNKNVIFVIPGVDLHNKISFLDQFDDLEKSASSTVEAKNLRGPRAASESPIELKIGM